MKTLKLIKNDPWLAPYKQAIEGRHNRAVEKISELTGGTGNLSDFADGYLYFGLHKENGHWVFREWAPNANAIYLIGNFSNWKERPEYRLLAIGRGVWEIKLPLDTFRPQTSPLLIYECHIGMAQQEEKVGSYTEFKEKILPRIVADGYNAIQIMAIQEHPYYGSFGYHVSSFFAPSSRFGTPDELKSLIDEAHKMGIAVIMDIVHCQERSRRVRSIRWLVQPILLRRPPARAPRLGLFVFRLWKKRCNPLLALQLQILARRIQVRWFPVRRRHLDALLQPRFGTGFRFVRRLLQRRAGRQRHRLSHSGQ